MSRRALYARVDSKDGLFLAVYEHAMTGLRMEESVLGIPEDWQGAAPAEVAQKAVAEIADIYLRHEGLLRAVVLVSGTHPEIKRRGARHLRELGDRFTSLLMQVSRCVDHPVPEAAIRNAFTVVYSTLSIRVAYGPGFASPVADDGEITATLTEMVRRYLFLGAPPSPAGDAG